MRQQGRYYPHFTKEKKGSKSFSDFIEDSRLSGEMRRKLGYLTSSLMPASSCKTDLIQSMLSRVCFLFRRCDFLTSSPNFGSVRYKAQGPLSTDSNICASAIIMANIYWALTVIRHSVKPFRSSPHGIPTTAYWDRCYCYYTSPVL